MRIAAMMTLRVLIGLVLLAAPLPSFAGTVELFAKIGDLKGESLDDKHKDEIVVLSWSWGVSQTGSTGLGAGGGAGKASFSDFHFTHQIDRASPLLMKACATGMHIKDATIIVRKKGGTAPLDYLVVEMKDVIITNVQPTLSVVDSDVESVSLQAAQVHLVYKSQKADGSLDEGVHFNYDIKHNKEG
jgi:type VI secretion system secreted protein Hcp